MSNLDRNTKVLIVGAGVSGLALAQILRGHGIDFEIFERDDGSRKQGWTLGLDECLPALRELLPKDIPDIQNASVNQSIGKQDGVAFINAVTHRDLGVLIQGSHDLVMAERRILREMWSEKINVQYSKRLKSYEFEAEDVEVRFHDGSSARGTILVGADGANSKIRRQMFGGFEAVASKAIILNGDVELTEDEYRPLVSRAANGVLWGQPGLKGAILIAGRLDDKKAPFHWDLAYLQGDSRANHKEQIYQKAVELTSHLPSWFSHAIKRTGPEGVLQPPPINLVETVLPVDKLLDGSVTLAGDAAHSMVPFNGMGANTALLDVCDLAKAIIDGVEKEKAVGDVLRAYEEHIIPRRRKKVRESRETAESDSNYDVSGGRLDRQKIGNGVAVNGHGKA